eukprot:m.90950 g.90950  ORF g.90950 m.90950 type:complete len:452 (-) comp18192_c6_seq1:113-1468(-)
MLFTPVCVVVENTSLSSSSSPAPPPPPPAATVMKKACGGDGKALVATTSQPPAPRAPVARSWSSAAAAAAVLPTPASTRAPTAASTAAVAVPARAMPAHDSADRRALPFAHVQAGSPSQERLQRQGGSGFVPPVRPLRSSSKVCMFLAADGPQTSTLGASLLFRMEEWQDVREALYWLERGAADHLRSFARHMNLMQEYYGDSSMIVAVHAVAAVAQAALAVEAENNLQAICSFFDVLSTASPHAAKRCVLLRKVQHCLAQGLRTDPFAGASSKADLVTAIFWLACLLHHHFVTEHGLPVRTNEMNRSVDMNLPIEQPAPPAVGISRVDMFRHSAGQQQQQLHSFSGPQWGGAKKILLSRGDRELLELQAHMNTMQEFYGDEPAAVLAAAVEAAKLFCNRCPVSSREAKPHIEPLALAEGRIVSGDLDHITAAQCREAVEAVFALVELMIE